MRNPEMRNLNVGNSKPASPELQRALVPGAVRVEILKFGDLANQRADQLKNEQHGMVHAIPNYHHPIHGFPTNGDASSAPTELHLPADFVVDPAKRQVFDPWIPGVGVRSLGEERSFVRMQLMDLHRTQANLDSGVKTSHGVTRPFTDKDRQNLEESIKHLKRVTGEKLDELNSSVKGNWKTYNVYHNSRRPGSYRNP